MLGGYSVLWLLLPSMDPKEVGGYMGSLVESVSVDRQVAQRNRDGIAGKAEKGY